MERKVLVLANSSCGLYDFRQELIQVLSLNNSVVASTPFNRKILELEKLGVRLIETPMERRGTNQIKDLLLFFRYLWLLNKEKPDMTITYTIKPNIYGGAACRLLGRKCAVNITGLGAAFEGDGFLRKMVTEMYRFALKKVEVVFFENSENMQLFIDERIIRKEQAKLLNGAGVNLERFTLLPYPQVCEETRFLFIGRVMAEKGVDELLAAMRKLRADGVKCSLDMLGGFEEDYAAKIRMAEGEGWLRYHGYQDDVRPFIERCHCFVLPSWHEGMSNANLECAASGRPVITSNIHGCLEAVEDEVSGYLVKVKNADELYMKMKRFCKLSREAREAMGLAGHRRMEMMFDKRKVINETIKALTR